MPAPLFTDLGGFQQVGMIVSDLDATMAYMVHKLGVGPFFVLRDLTMDHFRFRGAPSPAPVVSVGIAQAGAVQLELIQQLNDAPSIYREFLAAGREGCQHLAVWLDDQAAYERTCAQLLDAGLTLAQESGSTAFIRSAFFETDILGGMMIEVSEQRLPVVQVFGDTLVQASRDWRGEDPVRPWRSLAPS